MTHLLISTGEVSGDLQGSLLIKALHQEARKRGVTLRVSALGGPRMQTAGAELLANTTPLGAIGLWEALPLVLPTLQLQGKARRWLASNPPDGVVLIDYMGGNTPLGRRVKRERPELPVLYYIAPQEWAFRMGEGGTTRLIGFSDQILAIFPEEARFYRERGAVVHWVGHPLLDTLGELPSRAAARQELAIAEDESLLLLLPASRKQELRWLLPPLAEAAARLQKICPKLKVIAPSAQPGFEQPLRDVIDRVGLKATVLNSDQGDRLRPTICAAADLALTKSGTVNLELALRGVPQVVGYRVSRLTALMARRLLRFQVEHISPVNLVLGERLVPELLQEQLQVDQLVAEALPLLQNPMARQEMLAGYGRLRALLGEPGVTQRAAALILDAVVKP
ncbi:MULTISPECIES: lipid-A-disaccharide synthase [Synechococcus]|uniref:lipid-A-disaccharide synthase n=1 Tax=Synechococcus TaxID=1129 RepID=UPI0020CEE1D5|nr:MULTISPECIES: lipid-A-disaccharide synthase [Synechococcus]MCP9811930.1 lipid-A-disaccharide synthase [Synechococcus lacustris Maggiore-St4-Slac]MCP9924643.1 lipid-A-disaccharide synthase [Synechococcus lacustris C3-12m-Tous]